jgi:PAS domain S-box-containing protein
LNPTFSPPQNHPDEEQRLKSLHSLRVLDTEPEAELDAIVSAASRVCGVPIALISLVDAERQWFKARYGLAASETPRNISFCGHAILSDQIFEVEDARSDPRFAGNPLVTGDPEICFYAGIPLQLDDGAQVGTLCVMDRVPHHLDQTQREILKDLAQAAVCMLQKNRDALEVIAWKKRVEVENKASRHLASIVRYSFDAIITKTLQGVVTSWNRGAERMFGYTEDEMLNQPIQVLFPEDRLGEEREFQAHILRQEVVENVETVRRHKSGALLHVTVTLSPLYGSNGELIGISKIARDVSDRVAAQAERDAAGMRSQQIIESMVEGVVVQQADGSIFTCNTSAQTILGLSFEQMVGRRSVDPSWRCVHEDLSEWPGQSHPGMLALATGQEIKEAVMGVYRPDGSLSWISINAKPVFLVGESKPDSVIATFVDVTERRLSEEAQRISEATLLQVNQSLEQRVAERTQELLVALQVAHAANRSRAEFLANTSHEIRTPMNSVLGMAYLALQSTNDPQQRVYLNKIQRSGAHLMHIIDDILDISKIDAGKLVLEYGSFDLDSVLDHVLHLTEDSSKDKDLSLRLERDTEIPRFLQGDGMRVKQIMLNFVSNAIKFTERGGIVLKLHFLPCERPYCLLRFEVTDSGIGLTEAEIARLFKSFEQADNSITRKFGGTGLGLAICKQLALLMGGDVGVNSTPNLGSTFWFQARFGIADQSMEAVDNILKAEAAALALRGRSILVVDDNEFNLDVARGLLEGLNCQVTTAVDGKQALKLLRAETYACVLMDVQMPVMDGLVATRQIRADAALADTIVIAMTANASGVDRALCVQIQNGLTSISPGQ